ncbi:MAG: HNH endonuclease signature motif containing protein [Lachnospiraceae bacterium]|nr:HNH endonuclease signature motif containing protein [Lachnospiraceae bacterium]
MGIEFSEADKTLIICIICIVVAIFLIYLILKIYSNSYIKNNIEELRNNNIKLVNNTRYLGSLVLNTRDNYMNAINTMGLNQTIYCSNSVVGGALNNSIKYILKYSNIENSKEYVEMLDYCIGFQNAYDDLFSNISLLRTKMVSQLPFIVRNFGDTYKLPYLACDLRESELTTELPEIRFSYTSPKGQSTNIAYQTINVYVLENLQSKISEKINKKDFTKSQRSAMTNDLRNAIKQRDNYTCCICGNSVYNEPNLLLEVDHIIPVSKGGKTEASNLQTLCWRCNRDKSDDL